MWLSHRQCRQSIDDDYDELDDYGDEDGLSDYGGQGFAIDDGGPLIFDVTMNTRRIPTCAFGYSSLGGASNADDEEYDAEYARSTRDALEAKLDEADAALFGEAMYHASNEPHVRECEQWHQTLGCLRVRGRTHAGLPRPHTGEDEQQRKPKHTKQPQQRDGARWQADAAEARYATDDDEGRSPKRPVTTAAHCLLPAALGACRLQLSVVGVAVAAQPADESAIASGAAEEVFTAHGVLSETIAAHHTYAVAADGSGGLGGGGPSAPTRRPAEPATASAGRCTRRTETWCTRRLGLPPRSPSLAIADSLLAILSERVWRSLVPLLTPLVLAIARALLGVPDNNAEDESMRGVLPTLRIDGGSGGDGGGGGGGGIYGGGGGRPAATEGAASALRRKVAAAPSAGAVVTDGGGHLPPGELAHGSAPGAGIAWANAPTTAKHPTSVTGLSACASGVSAAAATASSSCMALGGGAPASSIPAAPGRKAAVSAGPPGRKAAVSAPGRKAAVSAGREARAAAAGQPAFQAKGVGARAKSATQAAAADAAAYAGPPGGRSGPAVRRTF